MPLLDKNVSASVSLLQGLLSCLLPKQYSVTNVLVWLLWKDSIEWFTGFKVDMQIEIGPKHDFVILLN